VTSLILSPGFSTFARATGKVCLKQREVGQYQPYLVGCALRAVPSMRWLLDVSWRCETSPCDPLRLSLQRIHGHRWHR
jgi:hypothetical protein